MYSNQSTALAETTIILFMVVLGIKGSGRGKKSRRFILWGACISKAHSIKFYLYSIKPYLCHSNPKNQQDSSSGGLQCLNQTLHLLDRSQYIQFLSVPLYSRCFDIQVRLVMFEEKEVGELLEVFNCLKKQTQQFSMEEKGLTKTVETHTRLKSKCLTL